MKTQIYEYDQETFLKQTNIQFPEFKLLYEYDGELKLGQNIQIGNEYYRWCVRGSEKERKETGYDKWLMERYTYNPVETPVENYNNPICPVCGYVDYNGWEHDSGEYDCPQCKAKLELSKRGEWCDGEISSLTYITNVVKVVRPKKLNLKKVTLC